MTELELTNSFNNISELLAQWGDYVDNAIKEILKEESFKNKVKIPPKYRLKDLNSFISKAFYRNKDYDDPLKQIEDKIGTRVVLLTSDHVYELSERLNKWKGWDVKISKDIKKLILEKPLQFEYQSLHLIVKPNQRYPNYDESNYECLTCEIQIRTLLQHAFAEISHDTTYKGTYKSDNEIHRRLSKSMALMEASDDYFCQVYDMMEDKDRKYRNYLSELIKIYRSFYEDFDDSTIDYELTYSVLDLLNFEDVEINKIEKFVIKEKQKLENIMTHQSFFFVKQPIVLLIFYFCKKHKDIIKEHLDISQNTMKNIFRSLNLQFD